MVVLSFRAVAQRLIKEHARISLKSQPHYPTIAKSLSMVCSPLMRRTMGGNIIMTSRRSDCAHFGVGLEVKEMSKEEGVELLLSTARLPVGNFPPLELIYYFALHPNGPYRRSYSNKDNRSTWMPASCPGSSWSLCRCSPHIAREFSRGIS